MRVLIVEGHTSASGYRIAIYYCTITVNIKNIFVKSRKMETRCFYFIACFLWSMHLRTVFFDTVRNQTLIENIS